MLLRLQGIPSQPLRLREIPRPLLCPRSKRYTLSIIWEMSKECWLQSLWYWWHWSWQSSLWKWSFLVQSLFHISSSLPWTWWRSTSLQLSLSGSCSTSRSCQSWIPTSISVLIFGSFLILFWLGFILPKLSGSQKETKAKQKCSSSNLFKLNLVLATLQLTQLVALQRDWSFYKLESNLLQTLF